MKAFTVICLLALAALASARPEESKYTDKYDNINVQEILDNQRLLHPYLKCILDQGKCTPEGKELRSHIRDALETGCKKCTETQERESRHVIDHLVAHEPGYWQQLKDKYDPENKYAPEYEKKA